MSLDFWIEDVCECCGHDSGGDGFNITHNLGRMAQEAGIYQCLWRPEEINCKIASEIVGTLEKGIEDMKANPVKYKKFDSDNGWGTYKDFVPWLEKVLACCKEHPDGKIIISR